MKCLQLITQQNWENLYCLEKYEINFPSVVLAYRYLNISNYTYDNMVKQVKAVYSESKQKQSEEKIKVKIEDEGHELEETFYSNMANNEKIILEASAR